MNSAAMQQYISNYYTTISNKKMNNCDKLNDLKDRSADG